MDTLERELKLVPDSPELLDTLAAVERLGPFEARGRRTELQRNSFFDSASGSLAAARVGFRGRSIAGQPLATWSIKGAASHVSGVASRRKSSCNFRRDGSVLALERLVDAARSRGARCWPGPWKLGWRRVPCAALPRDGNGPTHRRPGGAVARLGGGAALDRMRSSGHDYAEIEIEAELKRGDEAALDAVRAAIEALGLVHESLGSKLSPATAHVAGCTCRSVASP